MEEYTSIGSIQAPYGCVFRREAKSVRMQILVRPYVKADICNDAREKNISVNELISRILEAYIENQKAKEKNMRKRYEKIHPGRGCGNKKEVSIDITGKNRFSLSIKFYNDSHKKATDTGYVAIEIDEELNRMYFVPEDSYKGFKVSSQKDAKAKTVKVTIKNKNDWENVVGNYFLLKDVAEGLYYIDYSNK